jgi:hypothetical protein
VKRFGAVNPFARCIFTRKLALLRQQLKRSNALSALSQ